MTARIWVGLVTFTWVALAPPKLTVTFGSPWGKLFPVIVTSVPPTVGPWFGLMPLALTTGMPSKVNSSAAGAVPPCAVMQSTAGPSAKAGVVTLASVSLTAVTSMPGVKEPLPQVVKSEAWVKVTAVMPVRPVPVMVTTVPPVSGPKAGLRPFTPTKGRPM